MDADETEVIDRGKNCAWRRDDGTYCIGFRTSDSPFCVGHRKSLVPRQYAGKADITPGRLLQRSLRSFSREQTRLREAAEMLATKALSATEDEEKAAIMKLRGWVLDQSLAVAQWLMELEDRRMKNVINAISACSKAGYTKEDLKTLLEAARAE